MISLKRALLGAAAAVALSACAALPGSPIDRPVASASAKPAWAHQASDLKPDPAVRYGVLPNGMRYAIMKNATPPEQASLRLRIDAGSLMERDDQVGLAHFLEHMAFNGSKNVPEGEMIKRLERHGLKFGPDTNASTSFDETVYMLDLPRTDEETLDVGLMLMRETAGNLLLETQAIDRERGIILSEERSRDTPSLRMYRRLYDFFYKGQRAPTRFPIGDTSVIKAAPRDRFVEFYREYYRPERASLVVVGDFDPDAVEAKIRALFSDWRGEGKPGTDPDLGPVLKRGSEVELFVDPGVAAGVQIAWLSPPDLDRDTDAERRAHTVRSLGFAVLNRRYERLARSAGAPFLGAGAYRYTNLDAADVVAVNASAEPSKLLDALRAAEQEQRRLVQYGITQAELDREITEYRASLKAAAAAQETRRTPALAQGLVDAINDEEVFTDPATNLEVFERAVAGLKAETVNAVLREQFKGEGPLVFVTAPTAPAGGEAAIAQAFAESRAAAVSAPVLAEAKPWPYVSFGEPGAVVERQEIADLGTTFVRFANGTRLTVKPTKFRKDQVLVSARVGEGRLDLPPTGSSVGAWAAASVLTEGGLKALTAEEMEQVLSGEIYGAGLSVGDDAFSLSGGTVPQDLDTQMQVLAAYLTEPGWRTEPVERVRAYADTLHDQMQSTPSGVLGRDLGRLLRSGDARWATPSREQIRGLTVGEVQAALRPMADGPVEVVIVGDVTVEEAIRQTAATFGAIRRPPQAANPAPATVRFPAPTAQPVRLTHKGRADQAIVMIGWATADLKSDTKRARALRVLEQVLQLRLNDEMRESQGVTYSPFTGFDVSWEHPGYGYITAGMEAPPEKLEGFFADVSKIAKALRDEPITADELERARKPRAEAIEKARSTNEYWLAALSGAQTDPAKLTLARTVIEEFKAVTAADVQRAAREYLRDDRSWKLLVVPEGK